MPEGVEDGIVRGLYRYRAAPEERSHRAQILASGTMMLAALEAQQLLAEQHDVAADVWSATSYKLLREDALERRALEPAAPDRGAAHAVRHRAAAGDRGPDRRGDRLPEDACPTRSRASCRSRSSRSAPTATATPTPGPRCAATSRSTPPTSWSRRSTAWPSWATSRARSSPTRSARYEIDAEAPGPPHHLTRSPFSARSTGTQRRSACRERCGSRVLAVALLVGVPGLLGRCPSSSSSR